MTDGSGWGNPIEGGTVLRIPALQSPDFSIANQTGWAIFADGTAYFFNLTATGTVTGATLVVDGANGGVFIYSGAPAAGNLIGSWAGAAGTDAHGNTYPQGLSVTIGDIAGSTISGSVFNGTDFQLNSNGAFFYSGTPGPGNLIASITGASGGMDPYLNQYTPGISVYGAGGGINMLPSGSNTALAFTPGPTPAGIAGIPELYGASSGTLQIVDGQDGTTYGTARRSLVLGSSSGLLTGLSNIFTSPVAPAAFSNRTYRVHAQLYINGNSGAQVNCNLSVPSLVSGSFGYTVSRGAFTAFGGSVAGTPNTPAGLALSLGTAAGYVMTLDGEFAVSGSGTFALQIGSITATGLVVAAGSMIDIMPV